MRKVKMIDINTITLNGIVSAVFIRTIAVVIAPGPANIGTASGKKDISSLSPDSFISSGVCFALDFLPCIISIAIANISIPPITRSESTVI
jgi:hypothetical protein